MGIQAKQKIGSVWDFCKGFEDWLDLKCILHEVIEVHVSRNHFCVVKVFRHTHSARYGALVKETLIIFSYLNCRYFLIFFTSNNVLRSNWLFCAKKCGKNDVNFHHTGTLRVAWLTFLSSFWLCAFRNGWIIIFVLAFRTQNKTCTFVDFIHKLSLIKIEERLLSLYNGDVCKGSRNLKYFDWWCSSSRNI